jgi:hypothetical protein
MTIEQDYLRKIDELDTEITKLRKQRQSLFIEYMHYIARRKDPQTDLCDFIKEQELKDEK